MKVSKKYLSNKELYKEIVYSKAKGRLTPQAATMLMLLGKNVIKKNNAARKKSRLSRLVK